MTAAWIPCECCENFLCTIHGTHAHDCECPPIDEWDIDPYSESPMTASKEAKAAGLKNLLLVTEMTGVHANTLINWHKKKPELFRTVIYGCLARIQVGE